MAHLGYKIAALWDEEAQVFVSESNIKGFHIEAATIEEFEDLMMAIAPELVAANHLADFELASKPLSQLIPGIIWERPASPMDARRVAA
jgi:hypothetical protein